MADRPPSKSGSVEPQPPYLIEPLGKHDRAAFTRASASLDQYFRNQVTQNIRRHVARCMVAIEVATGTVAGFHMLSATNLALSDLPDAIAKKLPRYPVVPAVLMERLAVSVEAQGQQLGRALIVHAVEYIATSNIGAFAIAVDAKDDRAQKFYEKLGFVEITNQPRRLLLPIGTALALLKP